MVTRLKVPSRLMLPEHAPRAWPRFSSPLRSTALTARIGRLVGIFFGICFVTGMLSHYHYHPWGWLPEPVSPAWGYRVTQGTHIITGTALIPLVLVKLWSVYPKLFSWPPAKSVKHGLERLSIAVLVASVLVELFTGLMNAMDWYLFPWSFVDVHRFLGYVVIGSILLHVAIKLPDIKYGLNTPVAKGDVLTEIPWEDNPDAYSNNDNTHVDPPAPSGISRRGVLVTTGAGVGVVVATMAGQTLRPLSPIGLLAIRQPFKGPQHLPVNRLAAEANITSGMVSNTWMLEVAGPRTTYRMSIADTLARSTHEADISIACVEGWSSGAHWRGMTLLDVITRAGGNADSEVRLVSLEQRGSFNVSYVKGPQVASALLATHLNGERLNLDHGYPLRLICPNRAGVLNTKWLSRIEVL